MNRISRIATLFMGLALAVSCVDLSGIEQEIKDLDSRVKALETQVENLNVNVEALKVLAGGGTINKVEFDQSTGTYTLTMSNGQVLTIKQGSLGVGTAPIMSIDKDGYWMVDYSDGNGPQYVLDPSGNKVFAVGQNGVTPVFGVDKDGNWTISYDGGKTFSTVLDANGKPVKAVSGSTGGVDSYFKEVRFDDDKFVLVLRNGDEYVVPVCKGFKCIIENDGSIQFFEQGETRSYQVRMEGVSNHVIVVPQGWDAILSSAGTLSVTSPILTKAAIADSMTDVSIIAFTSQGMTTIAKLLVQVSGVEREVVPVANVNYLRTEGNSLVFSVLTDECTEWYYLCKPSSEPAPAGSTIQATGTKGSGQNAQVTVAGLLERTQYTFYVVPLNGTKRGSVAQDKGTTGEIEDRYTAYINGSAITVAGVEYSQDKCGAPELFTATHKGTQIAPVKRVVFIDTPDGTSVQFVAKFKTQDDMLIISRYASKRAYVENKISGITIYAGAAIAFKGLSIDNNGHDSVFLSIIQDTEIPYIYIDDCDYYSDKLPFFYSSSKAMNLSLRMWNCNVALTDVPRDDNTSDNGMLFNYSTQSTSFYKCMEWSFRNNLFYSKIPRIYKIVQCSTAGITQCGGETLEWSNNTQYNVTGRNVFVQVNHADDITLKNNLIWMDGTMWYNTAKNNYFLSFNNNNGSPDEAEWHVSDNAIYGPGYATTWGTLIVNSGSALQPLVQTVDILDVDPFSTVDPDKWIFRRKAAFTMYGASRD